MEEPAQKSVNVVGMGSASLCESRPEKNCEGTTVESCVPQVVNKKTRSKALRKMAQKVAEISNFEVAKLGLRLPSFDVFDEGQFLDSFEMSFVAKQLEKNVPPVISANEVFVATENQLEDKKGIEELRENLVTEYAETVFRPKLYPNPGPRGNFGVAKIPLKENAKPTWSRPYPMQGEKLEAYKKIVEDWIAQDLIERPKKEGIVWCSAGFPVPKKSVVFPWRGVVDVRGPNSQTNKCNYPLPIIEDILVQMGEGHIFS